MLTLITGAPGSGKSAALVSMLEELGVNGRPLYVNGITDLTIPHEPLEDPDKWFDTVPDGSVIILDEVQRYWRPRGPGQKVPPHISLLETHRHRGLDFYVITQGPNLIDSNARALAGRHVHLRDLGLLGRWWYEWPECADNCRTAWKNAPIKKRYRLPKHVFDKYKSASVHIKPVRSVPWMLAVMVLALITVISMTYIAYGKIQARMNPQSETAVAQSVLPGENPPGPLGQNPQPSALPAPSFIDDRIAFIPRVSNVPESAPAYDALRVIVNMPTIAGAVCKGQKCICYTQQGTPVSITNDDCKAWMATPSFDHYRLPPPETKSTPPLVASAPEPLTKQTTSRPMPDGSVNPKADSNPPPFAMRMAAFQANSQ